MNANLGEWHKTTFHITSTKNKSYLDSQFLLPKGTTSYSYELFTILVLEALNNTPKFKTVTENMFRNCNYLY